MSGAWGSSWGTSWGTSWDRIPAAQEESLSQAGLRAFMRLEMPSMMMHGDGVAQTALDIAGIISTMAELGESVTIDGTSVNVIGVTPYFGVQTAGQEIEGRISRLYCTATAWDAIPGALGLAVVFRSITYTVGRVERLDAGIVRLELAR